MAAGSPEAPSPTTENIRSALSDPELPSQAEKLLDDLTESVREGIDANRRSILVLLLLAAALELMNRAVILEVNLAGFAVKDISVVRKILPPVAAYLVYDISAGTIRNRYTKTLIGAINKTYRPALFDSQYVRLAQPRGSSFFGPFFWYGNRSRLRAVIEVMSVILRAGSTLIPLALIVYWLTVSFRDFGFADPLVWIGFVVAGGFIVLAILVVAEGVQSAFAGGWRIIFLTRRPGSSNS